MRDEEYEKMYRFEEKNWWYQGRRELVLDIIHRIKINFNDKQIKILDAGCGTGINLKSFQEYGTVIGLDYSKEALSYCKFRGICALTSGVAESLPLRDETFEIVCALDVLEHIDDDLAAIGELFRVLKEGGILIVTVPAFQFLWSNHDAAMHHKRRYVQRDLIAHLESCGFSVEMCTYWNFFLFVLVALVRLLGKKEPRCSGAGLQELPIPLNKALIHVLRVERYIIMRNIGLPLGVSILSVCKKDPEDMNAN
jgi:ubiquinone/menaquinone biosynthesis C-methylase UbiE